MRWCRLELRHLDTGIKKLVQDNKLKNASLRGTKQSRHRQINYAKSKFLFALYSIEIASYLTAMTRCS